jgi:hypothetical protein
MAMRSARAASPIGRGKTRKWVFSTSPSARTATSLLIDAIAAMEGESYTATHRATRRHFAR